MYIFFLLLALFAIFDIARGYRKAKEKNRYLIKSFAGTFTVIISLFIFGPFFMISPIKLGYSSLKENGLSLYFPSSNKERGREIFEMAKDARDANEKFYKKKTSTTILIGKSDFDMLRFGVYPKGNGGGIPWGVVIRESKATTNIITHEMSHKNLANLSFINATPIIYPRWFDEGLASYIGKMDYYKGIPELKEAMNEGRYPKDITGWKGIPGMLKWISNTFGGVGSRVIYGQTYQMIKYLSDNYGEDKVYQIAVDSSKTGFEKTFLREIGKTSDQFHLEFVNYITQNSTPGVD